MAIALAGCTTAASQHAQSHAKPLTVSAAAVLVGNAPLTVSAGSAEPAEGSNGPHAWMRVPLVYRNQVDRPLFLTIYGGGATRSWGSDAHPLLLRADSDGCVSRALAPGASVPCAGTSLSAELAAHGSFTDTVTLLRDAPGMASLRVGTYSGAYRISWSSSGLADVHVAYDVHELGRASKRHLADRSTASSTRTSADLDGDGTRDRFVIDETRRQLRVGLGNGRTMWAPWTSPPGARIAAIPDIRGDGRHQVVIETPDKARRFAGGGVIVVVQGDELVIDNMQDFGYLRWGGFEPGEAAGVWCGGVAGRPALVMTWATTSFKGQAHGPVTRQQLADLPHDRFERRWSHQVLRLDGTSFSTGPEDDSGVAGLDDPAPAGIPLNDRLDCGGGRKQ